MSLTALSRSQLALATTATSGRSAHTVIGGHEHTLRQTMIALTAGHALDEHENPGEATVQRPHRASGAASRAGQLGRLPR